LRTHIAAAADIGISSSRFDLTVKDGRVRIDASADRDRKSRNEAFDALPREEGSNL